MPVWLRAFFMLSCLPCRLSFQFSQAVAAEALEELLTRCKLWRQNEAVNLNMVRCSVRDCQGGFKNARINMN